MTQPKWDYDPPLSEVLKPDEDPRRHLWYCDVCQRQKPTTDRAGVLVCDECDTPMETWLAPMAHPAA